MRLMQTKKQKMCHINYLFIIIELDNIPRYGRKLAAIPCRQSGKGGKGKAKPRQTWGMAERMRQKFEPGIAAPAYPAPITRLRPVYLAW
jgi:hypothetical protein